jgi:hypothetical protein
MTFCRRSLILHLLLGLKTLPNKRCWRRNEVFPDRDGDTACCKQRCRVTLFVSILILVIDERH